MEFINPEDIGGFVGTLVELWQTAGRVGPIVSVAVGVIGLVWLARRQLTQWLPWLATRHGALFLVGLFAFGGSAGVAALEGETSLLAIIIQAGAAAFTAIGIRSGAKAALTGGAAEMEAFTGDGEKVLVMRHEHVRKPKDFDTHPEKYEPPRGL